MTVTVANTANTNTFAYLITRVNELAAAMSNLAVTVNSNTAVGNAAITGTFSAGFINVASFSANTLAVVSVATGNTTVNVAANGSSVVVSSATQFTSVTPGLMVSGNSTVQVSVNSTSLQMSSVVVNTTSVSVGTTMVSNAGFFVGSSNLQSTGLYVGSVIVNTSIVSVGSVTANTTALGVGSVTVNASSVMVGNTTANTVSNSSGFFVNGNPVLVTGTLADTVGTYTTTGTTAQVVDFWALGNYRASEYVVSIKNNSANGYQVSKFLIFHDGGNQYFTEFAQMQSNGSLGSFTTGANATHVLVNFTPAAANTTLNFSRKLLGV